VTLRGLRLPLLMLPTWVYRDKLGLLGLLSLGPCGPRVAATCVAATTSELVDQHSQHSTCDGSYPPLTSLLRCASVRVRARFLGAAAFVLIRHFLFGASSVGRVNWWMGEYVV
jgi:hypothetical protein